MLKGPRWHLTTLVAAGLTANAIGLLLYLDTSQSQALHEHRAAQKAQEYHDAASKRAFARCSLLPRTAIRECVHDQYDAAAKGAHDEYDLQAQLVTSEWTRAMGIAALIAMAVGIFGVGLIYTTFRETRRAANATDLMAAEAANATLAAVEASKAGQEANKIARETAEHQLRAYLYPGSTILRLEPGTVAAKASVDIALRNTGQTPATLLYYRFRSKYCSPRTVPAMPDDQSTKWKKMNEVTTNIQKVAGPNNEIDLSFDGSALTSDIVGKAEIFATLEWRYQDYLGRKWEQTAEFTTDDFSWNGTESKQIKLRQRRTESRLMRA